MRFWLTLIVSAWLLVSVAEAQTIPAFMRVPPSFVLGTMQPTKSNAQSGMELQATTRRNAYMIAVGTGLITAGVLHAALLGGPVCYEREDRVATAIPLGGLVATTGLVLGAVGALKTVLVPRARRKLKEGDGVLLSLAFLGTGVVASGLLFAAAAPQLAACVSS